MSLVFYPRQQQNSPPVITVAPIPLPIPTISDVSPLLPPLSPVPSSNLASALSSGTFSSSISSTSSPSSTAQSASNSGGLNLPHLKLVYLIPAIVVVGIVILIFLIWSIQSCCTRNHRKNKDDPEKGSGFPPYSPNFASNTTWQEYGRTEPRFSYNGIPLNQHHPHRRMSRPQEHSEAQPNLLTSRFSSDSLVALGLDDSEEDEKELAPDREVAWESLRHKSIKRGIMDQVRDERNWMDSLRAVAGSVFVNQSEPPTQPRDIEDRLTASRPVRGVALRDDGPIRQTYDSGAGDWIEEGRRRRKNLSLVSKGLANRTGMTARSISNTFRRTSTSKPSGNAGNVDPGAWSPQTGFKIVLESPIASPTFTSPILHTNFGASQPTAGARGIETSPTKKFNRYTQYPVGDPRISFLPLSPPQIMSPPLEGELCFSPPLGTAPTLQTLANLVVQSERGDPPGKRDKPTGPKGKATTTAMVERWGSSASSSGAFDMDQPLPDPRGRSREFNVDMVKLDKPRNKLFKKRSVLMGFRYERFAGSLGMENSK